MLEFGKGFFFYCFFFSCFVQCYIFVSILSPKWGKILDFLNHRK